MQKSIESKQRYLVLVKLNPAKTDSFHNSLMNISEIPSEGVRLNATYNVFGEWDFAVWFEAKNNDEAVRFVGDKIRAIDGVVETVTMPATPIKEYKM
ncbi:MAG: Lrp/AsnC ligand binding domain-containing protein [Candidatus Bathyarchaeota archaeon]|nr:Lrp/AsnC ligand binding domain-containing protein [Candidatus Bathyarchaeota archaeon]